MNASMSGTNTKTSKFFCFCMNIVNLDEIKILPFTYDVYEVLFLKKGSLTLKLNKM